MPADSDSCILRYNRTISYTYNDLYRLIKVDYGNGESMEYTYDAAGNRLTREVTAQQLKAGFTANVTTGGVHLTVSFSDQSTGDVKSWQWKFGDGSTSQSPSPAHQYSKPGAYTVALTVTGSGESTVTDTCTKSAYIAIFAAPTANFTAAPVSGKAPLKVSFTDKSTGNITGRQLDFGDMQPASSAKNVVHTYGAIGTYKATLTVTGPGGTGSKTRTITVNR